MTAVEQFIPVKFTVQNSTGTKKQIKHYSCSIKKALARKKCLWRQMRTDPECIETKTAYKIAAAKYKILVRNYEIKKERRVITANDKGSFYNFINRKLLCKSGIGALRDDTGRLVTGDEQRSSILNQFFSSVGCTDNGVTPNMPSRVKSDINLESVWFDRAGVMKAIKKLKSNSASGPDGLPPLLLSVWGRV